MSFWSRYFSRDDTSNSKILLRYIIDEWNYSVSFDMGRYTCGPLTFAFAYHAFVHQLSCMAIDNLNCMRKPFLNSLFFESAECSTTLDKNKGELKRSILETTLSKKQHPKKLKTKNKQTLIASSGWSIINSSMFINILIWGWHFCISWEWGVFGEGCVFPTLMSVQVMCTT